MHGYLVFAVPVSSFGGITTQTMDKEENKMGNHIGRFLSRTFGESEIDTLYIERTFVRK